MRLWHIKRTIEQRHGGHPASTLDVADGSRILQHDGVTPATNVVVTANNTEQDTTTNGTAFFNNVKVPSTYGITAISQLGGDMYDGAQTNINVNFTGTNPIVTLILPLRHRQREWNGCRQRWHNADGQRMKRHLNFSGVVVLRAKFHCVDGPHRDFFIPRFAPGTLQHYCGEPCACGVAERFVDECESD